MFLFVAAQVSRDEPTMLGLDLVGLNPTFAAGKEHTEAFLPTVDKAVQQRFNSKVLGVWPAAHKWFSVSQRFLG
ncbi:hypothetical protein [Marinomonas sp. GJ51-6]|uniref:hypothetical protein n=1 Tax=Marinomonas sp. GJ51-6 TaxID=2992802 RepID=UPI002934E51B|nr:hypothetical protein [Marinomonas sp. GJ51-6]WOD07648.1 hypothetical protein ONZ50_00190 [Marinomonas sp. GJ51-6]